VTRKWVLNGSPLITLGKISEIHLLEELCSDLIVPDGVVRELDQGPVDDPARIWIHEHGAPLVRSVERVPPLILAWDLGKGETEVISWAYLNAGYDAILDDRAARNCSSSLGIKVIGTIGLVLLAKKEGILSQVKPLLRQIEESGFRITPELLRAAYKLANEE
jgi:predicted nucleic acid-binding protein